MKIELKFDVGQKVYDLKSTAEWTIKSIIIGCSEEGHYITYICLDDEYRIHYRGDYELSTEKPKPKSIYEIKEAEPFAWISSIGQIQECEFTDCLSHREMITQGNAFLTAEEAENEVKWRKVHQELKKLAGGYKFRNGKLNYFIIYNYPNKYVETTASSDSYCPGIIYFPTYEAAEEAIRIVGEVCLIYDYFGIKDEENGR